MNQTANRRLDSSAGEHGPREGSSDSELWSGKVPLRPIQRIGMLLLNGVPLLALILLFGARVIPALKGAGKVVLFLIPPLLVLWALIALAMVRWVWAALTAPSKKDE